MQSATQDWIESDDRRILTSLAAGTIMVLNAQSFVDLNAFVQDDDDEERDTWHVLMAPNDVRVLSLEQLDDTFRLGLINERTLVWRPSLVDWTELNSLIGDAEPDQDRNVWHVLVAPNRVVDVTLDQ